MRLTYIATCARMTGRELRRRSLVLGLALLVPVVFFAVVAATTGNGVIPLQLAAASNDATILAGERRQSLLFISIASAGIISAFFASSLIQQQVNSNRRLVLCGYRASELITARLVVLLGIVMATGVYTSLLLTLIESPRFPAGVSLGIVLAAFVHGCYGLLVGVIFRRELESIFATIVLINIDAGWLQNPAYYANAHSKWLIEALPAHYPAQASYIAAFTSEGIGRLAAFSLAYGAALLATAVVIYAVRMRVAR